MIIIDEFPDWFILTEKMEQHPFEFLRLYEYQKRFIDSFYFSVENVNGFRYPFIEFEDRFYLRYALWEDQHYIYSRGMVLVEFIDPYGKTILKNRDTSYNIVCRPKSGKIDLSYEKAK